MPAGRSPGSSRTAGRGRSSARARARRRAGRARSARSGGRACGRSGRRRRRRSWTSLLRYTGIRRAGVSSSGPCGSGHRFRRGVGSGRPRSPWLRSRFFCLLPAAADSLPDGVTARPRTVEAVQERLAELGYLRRSGVDGIWGAQSRGATIAFQKWEGPGARRDPRPDHAEGPSPMRDARRPLTGAGARGSRSRSTARCCCSSGGAGSPAPCTCPRASRASPPPVGDYTVFRKRRRAFSIPYAVWLPYASYFFRGIAVHQARESQFGRLARLCARRGSTRSGSSAGCPSGLLSGCWRAPAEVAPGAQGDHRAPGSRRAVQLPDRVGPLSRSPSPADVHGRPGDRDQLPPLRLGVEVRRLDEVDRPVEA